MRRGRYVAAEEFRWLTRAEMARELGMSELDVGKFLGRNQWWLRMGGTRVTDAGFTLYSAEVVEVIKGLLGQPHRHIKEPGESDWLEQWIGDKDD